MKIGIGGGIGPFRGGVSNKGLGGGIGPVSAGGSWGGCGGFLLLVFGIFAVVMFFLWPMVLGDWVATKVGAGDPSTARAIIRWAFEGVWLALLLLLALGTILDRASAKASPASEATEWDPPPLPDSVEYGTKTEKPFTKAWPRLARHLRPDETVLAAFRASKVRPPISLCLITDSRFLACSLALDERNPLPVNVPVEAIEAISYTSIDTLTVALEGGESIKVGSVSGAADRTRLDAAVRRAQGRPAAATERTESSGDLVAPSFPRPEGLTYGDGAAERFAKAWPLLGRRLDPEERVVAAFRVSRIAPAVDLCVITTHRVMTCSTSPHRTKPFPVDIPVNDVSRLVVGDLVDTTSAELMDGSTVKLGMLLKKADRDLLGPALESAQN